MFHDILRRKILRLTYWYAFQDFVELNITSFYKANSEVIAEFQTEEITTEFQSYALSTERNTYLQVVTHQAQETFSSVDSSSIFWGLIDLPDVKVEVTAPIEYTFYVDFKEKWKFHLREEDLGIVVVAPEIHYNTPAINISQMQVSKVDGSILRVEEDANEKLEKNILEICLNHIDQKLDGDQRFSEFSFIVTSAYRKANSAFSSLISSQAS